MAIALIRACAWGLRRKATSIVPGSLMSETNSPRPCKWRSSSRRSTEAPTPQASFAIGQLPGDNDADTVSRDSLGIVRSDHGPASPNVLAYHHRREHTDLGLHPRIMSRIRPAKGRSPPTSGGGSAGDAADLSAHHRLRCATSPY